MFSPVALCQFSAVPFYADPSDNRPLLAINPAHLALPPMVSGDVDGLAQALMQRIRSSLSQTPRAPDEPRRHARLRHNGKTYLLHLPFCDE